MANKTINDVLINVKFDEYANHTDNLVSKESLQISLGKIQKWKTDFHSCVWDGNAATVNNHTVLSDVPADAKFTDTTYTAGNGISLDDTQVLVPDGTNYADKLNFDTTYYSYDKSTTTLTILKADMRTWTSSDLYESDTLTAGTYRWTWSNADAGLGCEVFIGPDYTNYDNYQYNANSIEFTLPEDGKIKVKASCGNGYPITTNLLLQKLIVGDNVTAVNLLPATQQSIGGVIIGNGLSVTNDGTLSVNFPEDKDTTYTGGDGVEIELKGSSYESDLTTLTWEQGTNLDADGADSTSSTSIHAKRIRLNINSRLHWDEYPQNVKKFSIDVEDTNGTKLEWCYKGYTTDGTYTEGADTSTGQEYAWVSSGTIRTPQNTNTARIVINLRYPDNSEISVSNLGSCVLTLYDQDENEIEASLQDLYQIDLLPATTSTIGGVIIGDNINVTSDGTISVDDQIEYIAGDGISLNDARTVSLDYIQLNGGTVFDTGVTHQAHDTIEIIVQIHSTANGQICDSREYDVYHNAMGLRTRSYEDGQHFIYCRSSANRIYLGSNITIDHDKVYKLIMHDYTCEIYDYITNELLDTIDGTDSGWFLDDGLYSMPLGNIHNSSHMHHTGNFGYYRFYGMKWYRDNELIHNFIPVITESSASIYDLIDERTLTIDTNNSNNPYTHGTYTYVVSHPVNSINVIPATTTDIGGVIIGDGIDVDHNGVISVDIPDYSAGAGISIISNDIPVEYQEVEYIEGDGRQYINTEYCIQHDDHIEATMYAYENIGQASGSNWGRYPFGESYLTVTSSTVVFHEVFGFSVMCNRSWNTPAIQTCHDYTQSNSTALANRSDIQLGSTKFTFGEKVVVNMNEHEVTWYDPEDTSTILGSITSKMASNDSFDCEYPLYLFAYNTIDTNESSTGVEYGTYMRLYRFKVYNDTSNTLVRDFIPVIRKADNVAGLYESFTDKFYPSEGSIAFTAGNPCGITGDKEITNTGVLAVSESQNDLEVIVTTKDGDTAVPIHADIPEVPTDIVHSQTVTNIAVLTQAEYDALETPDPHTFYLAIST